MTNQKKKCKNVGEKKKHQHLSKNWKTKNLKTKFFIYFCYETQYLNWYEVVFVIILHSQTLPTEFLTYYLQILSLTFYMRT